MEKSIFSTKQTCIEIIFSSRIQIFSFLSVMVWPLEHLFFFQGQKVNYPVARHDICYLIFFTFNIDLRKTFGEIKNLLYWFHNIAIRISYFCMVASWLPSFIMLRYAAHCCVRCALYLVYAQHIYELSEMIK